MNRMRIDRRALPLVTTLALFCAFADGRTDETGEARIWPHDEMRWVKDDVLPAVKGVVLWGDPARGEHGMLRRFPAGYSPPPHAHPSVERVVVISGDVVVSYGRSGEKALGPGSYSEIPPNALHTLRCKQSSDCEFLLTSSGPFAIVPAPAN